jgi:hypothetical protein
MSTGPHLGSKEVAAYLDNTLSDAECARVKAHLADCDVGRGGGSAGFSPRAAIA